MQPLPGLEISFGVQLLSTKNGIPVEVAFLPDSTSDVRALNALP